MTKAIQNPILPILFGLMVLLFTSPHSALTIFIVLGQAHFILAYLYKLRSGRVTKEHFFIYTLLLIFVFSLAFWMPFYFLLLITAILFSIHFFFDEARILAGHNNTSFILLMPPILTFISSIIYSEMAVDIMLETIIISALIYCVYIIKYGIQLLLYKELLYLEVFVIFLTYIYIFNISISGEVLFGSVIVAHIVSWYVYYYNKLKNHIRKLNKYITDVLLLNVLIILSYIGFANNTDSAIFSMLGILFLPSYYYTWAILHIITSSGDLYTTLKKLYLLKSSHT